MAKPSRPSAPADNGMKKPQNRNSPRRPKAAIDVAELEELGMLHAPDQEIIDWFEWKGIKISRRTLKIKKFRQAIERGRSRGRIMLRRLQFEAAQRHDSGMLKLLGAKWLGQDQAVGVQGSGPRKKSLPGWLTRKGEGYEQEVPGLDFDDRATGNGGVQRSTVLS